MVENNKEVWSDCESAEYISGMINFLTERNAAQNTIDYWRNMKPTCNTAKEAFAMMQKREKQHEEKLRKITEDYKAEVRKYGGVSNMLKAKNKAKREAKTA